MKYIFDFDDVLFNNTKQFKEHMYACLEEVGVSRGTAETYYRGVRENQFSLKAFLTDLFTLEKDKEKKVEDLYKKIMRECPNFVNTELLERVRRIGIENCYIVTTGDEEFQRGKIRYSGIGDLFNESRIHIVPDSKRDVITKICDENAGKEIVFIDDKLKSFGDLKDLPNLITMHYKEDIVDIMDRIGDKGPNSELKRR